MTAPEDRPAGLHALIAAGSGGADTSADWLRRLCRVAVRELAASGAGVSLITDAGTHGLAAVSDPTSEVVEELQFTLGEGPCLDAHATRRTVLVPDLTRDALTRWPAYAPAAYEHGVRAVFAFPLQIGAACLGVLDVYRDEVGSLSGDALNQALAFAEVALTILLDEQERAGPQRIGAGAEGAPRPPRRALPGPGHGAGTTRRRRRRGTGPPPRARLRQRPPSRRCGAGRGRT